MSEKLEQLIIELTNEQKQTNSLLRELINSSNDRTRRYDRYGDLSQTQMIHVSGTMLGNNRMYMPRSEGFYANDLGVNSRWGNTPFTENSHPVTSPGNTLLYLPRDSNLSLDISGLYYAGPIVHETLKTILEGKEEMPVINEMIRLLKTLIVNVLYLTNNKWISLGLEVDADILNYFKDSEHFDFFKDFIYSNVKETKFSREPDTHCHILVLNVKPDTESPSISKKTDVVSSFLVGNLARILFNIFKRLNISTASNLASLFNPSMNRVTADVVDDKLISLIFYKDGSMEKVKHDQ